MSIDEKFMSVSILSQFYCLHGDHKSAYMLSVPVKNIGKPNNLFVLIMYHNLLHQCNKLRAICNAWIIQILNISFSINFIKSKVHSSKFTKSVKYLITFLYEYDRIFFCFCYDFIHDKFQSKSFLNVSYRFLFLSIW